MSNLKILFIGGAGRSGSTLLETLLGQIDGVVSVGEFNEIWKAGIIENRLCGCGHRFLQCDFWRSIFESSFGGVDRIDALKFIDLQDSTCRMRHVPILAWPLLQSREFKEKVQAYRDVHTQLFDGIRRVTGAKLIVDSSKTASQAYMLSKLEEIDLHVLLLVRDSRAVAYSWQRIKTIPDALRENPEMVRKTPIESAFDWNFRNCFVETLKYARANNVKSYSVLRYEDFAKAPCAVVSELAECLGIEADLETLFEKPKTFIRSRPTHSLEGNPSKFKMGNIDIRVDEEWQNAMRPLDRAIVSVLTAPYLKKFGYALS